MELGERLRLAREEAGLTQKELCGDTITRNMLSQLEHGTARPSLETLQILAKRLEKPVSYFLGEDAASPNTRVLRDARLVLQSGGDALDVLTDYRGPDESCDAEYTLLLWLGLVARAERQTDKPLYARELLARARDLETRFPLTVLPELRERRLLAGVAVGEAIKEALPSMDRSLLLRAGVSKEKAPALLDACEDKKSPRWNLLRGEAYVRAGQWDMALRCLRAAEKAFPERAVPLLERCCAALGDYRGAYHYAKLQRKA